MSDPWAASQMSVTRGRVTQQCRADYSQSTAGELGIADCFVGFLSKPNVIIDDQNVAEWRHCVEVGPLTAASSDAGDYRRLAELSDS